MTASTRNTLSAIRVLENALSAYRSEEDKLAPGELSFAFNIWVLLNSVRKCVASLDAQLRFHRGAKNHGRALITDDGEVIRGMATQALCVSWPDQEHDAVIYGRADALAYVAQALSGAGYQVRGPGKTEHLAQEGWS